MNEEQLEEHLATKFPVLEQHLGWIQDQAIGGQAFLLLSPQDFNQIITKLGPRLVVQNYQRAVIKNEEERDSKPITESLKGLSFSTLDSNPSVHIPNQSWTASMPNLEVFQEMMDKKTAEKKQKMKQKETKKTLRVVIQEEIPKKTSKEAQKYKVTGWLKENLTEVVELTRTELQNRNAGKAAIALWDSAKEESQTTNKNTTALKPVQDDSPTKNQSEPQSSSSSASQNPSNGLKIKLKRNFSEAFSQQTPAPICEICNAPGNSLDPLIACSGCNKMFHTFCVSLSEGFEETKDVFFCSDCDDFTHDT